MTEAILSGLKLFNRGKVRDIYDLEDKLLLVASDRISAFDVILPTLIPDKGKILTAMSEFWFSIIKDIVPHHLLTTRVEEFPAIDFSKRGRAPCEPLFPYPALLRSSRRTPPPTRVIWRADSTGFLYTLTGGHPPPVFFRHPSSARSGSPHRGRGNVRPGHRSRRNHCDRWQHFITACLGNHRIVRT